MLVALDSFFFFFAKILDLAGPHCFPLSSFYALSFSVKCEWLRDYVIPSFRLADMFYNLLTEDLDLIHLNFERT